MWNDRIRPSLPQYGYLRRTAFLCFLAGTALLAGCSLAPRYEAPPLPVATAYPADAWMQQSTTTEGRIAAARAAYGMQQADRFPTIAASIDGNRARIPADLNVTGQAQIASQYQVGVGLMVQTRRALLSSRTSLYAALGGGSMNSISISAHSLPSP